MTWRERQGFFPENQAGVPAREQGYKFASFKDAVFLVNSYTLDAGRRQSVQKFPGDRYTNVQDLGRDSSNVSVEAFLVGDDYDVQLKALEKALLEGGPGELDLPWRDTFTATVVGRINVDEDKTRRGFAKVTFECVETTPPPQAFQEDTAARMIEASENARDATRARFGDRFDAASQPETFRTRVRAAMDDASGKIVTAQGKVDGFVSEIAAGANQVNRLSGNVNNLINSPLDLSDEIVNAVITVYSSLRSTLETTQNVIETWGKGGPVRILADTVFNINRTSPSPVVDTSTPGGVIEQQNLDEFNRMVRLNHFYEMASVLAGLPFESYGQAVGLRTEFIDEIDGLLLNATPAEAEAILNLNEAVGAFLGEVAVGLPRLGTFTPSATLPALVIAHILYGDARANFDIVLRNSIKHPGFVPAGESLEVLGVGL